MADQIRVEGAAELDASARAASADLADMSRAQGQAGDYVAQVARGMAPVRSGALVGTIRAERATTEVRVTAGGPGVPYAGPIHWGWPARNISAQPFLVNALDQAETSVVGIYADEVERTVAKIHGK
jgi:hypothetical protein